MLGALEQFAPRAWEGEVYRHMFADYPPERENVRGARWNPPGVPAIYTSLERETAIAEADYYISLQPVRPVARRVVYRIEVRLQSIFDFSSRSNLAQFGVAGDELGAIGHAECQVLGAAAEWLGRDGMLVPSARAAGINLVIFPNQKRPGYQFSVAASEELPVNIHRSRPASAEPPSGSAAGSPPHRRSSPRAPQKSPR